MNVRGMLRSLIAISLTLSLDGMVFRTHLITPDGKHIFILGDMHAATEPLLLENFISLMNYLSAFPLKQPIPFIVEVGAIDKAELDKNLPASVKFLIKLYEAQKDQIRKSYEFVFYEPRNEVSSDLAGALLSVSNLLTHKLPLSCMEAHYQLGLLDPQASLVANEKAWKESSPSMKRDECTNSITIEHFLDYLEANEMKLKDLAQRRSNNKPFAAIILECLETYRESKRRCIEYYRGYEKQGSFTYPFVCLFDSCANVEERMCLYDGLYLHFNTNTDYLFADLFFLDKVLEKLESSAAVCLFVGKSHAQNVSTYLSKRLGCKVVSEENSVVFGYPLFSQLDAELKIRPNQVLDPFLEHLIMKDSCWSCTIKKEGLKVCAQCKKAMYCSADCQKKDWKTHKIVCVAAKQPEPVLVKTN